MPKDLWDSRSRALCTDPPAMSRTTFDDSQHQFQDTREVGGPGGQGPLKDFLGHAAERGDAGAGFGVEVHLAVRAVALEEASADLEERRNEVSDTEPVAVGQPVQVRQVRLALQRREPYRPRSCHCCPRRLRLGRKNVVHEAAEAVPGGPGCTGIRAVAKRGSGTDG
ncbi:hypothetical protein [Streptomyces sp. NRRL S-813]|uniref:hypothetical protein n=1 Tax=Streptomyces sp. NRRL S-813 TaxID=1463919 RepID=UPI0004BEBF95